MLAAALLLRTCMRLVHCSRTIMLEKPKEFNQNQEVMENNESGWMIKHKKKPIAFTSYYEELHGNTRSR